MASRKLFIVLFLHVLTTAGASQSRTVVTESCVRGFIPVNRSAFFDSYGDMDDVENMTIICGWGMYPGLQCNRWSEFFRTDLPPFPYFNGFFAGNVSSLLGGSSLSYNSFGTGPLPESYVMLSEEREGILYSNCRDNKTTSAFSVSRCVNCHSPSPLLATVVYAVLELLPVVLVCVVVALLNLNLAHGLFHSFVFFYQMLPIVLAPMETFSKPGNFTLMYGKFLWGFVSLENSILGIVNVSSLPCFAKEQDPFFVRVLDYSKALCITVTMLFLFFLAVCSWCPGRICRVGWMKLLHSVHEFKLKFACQHRVHLAISSLCVLVYATLLRVSFAVLSMSVIYYFPNSNATYTSDDLTSVRVPKYNGTLEYLQNQHTPYGAVAIVIVTLSMIFPLLLLCYPSLPQLYRRIRKKFLLKRNTLDSVLAAFQITFRDNFSFFAGLYLLYRLVLWAVIAFCPEVTQRFFLIQLTLVIIFAVHCLFQPFQDTTHNYIELLYLLNLNVIHVLTQKAYYDNYLSQVTTRAEKTTFVVLISFLSVLPLALVVLYCVYRLIRRCWSVCCGQSTYFMRQPQEMHSALHSGLINSFNSGDNTDTSSSDEFNDDDSEELLT